MSSPVSPADPAGVALPEPGGFDSHTHMDILGLPVDGVLDAARALGIGRRTNGVHHDGPARLCRRYQRRWIAPEKGNHRNTLFEANREAFFLTKLKDQIDTERP